MSEHDKQHAAHNHAHGHAAHGHAGHGHHHRNGHHSSRVISDDERQRGGYVCPMCAGVWSAEPGNCPKCGMALEPADPRGATKTQYTCPMHPEIVRDEPGSCPICGMALEPMTVSLDAGPSAELLDMTRRMIIGGVLTAPVLVLAMGGMVPGLGMLLEPCSPPRPCYGPAGRSLSAPGLRCACAARTCSP
jgi:hypothetical protein